VQSAEAEVRAAQLERQMFERLVMPMPTFGVDYGRQRRDIPVGSFAGAPVAGALSANWTDIDVVLNVGLPLPLFSRQRENRARATGRIHAAEAKVRLVRADVQSELNANWAALLGSDPRVSCAREVNGEAPMSAARSVVVTLVAAAVLALGACTRGDSPPAPPATSASPASAPATERVVGPLTPADAQALATMNDRLKEYVELHTKLERSLPNLAKEATPEQIDKNQRALEALVRKARAQAKPGDIFTPQSQPIIKRLLATVFGGPDGKQLKASIMDENPVDVKITVNGRYPDAVPLSTVPPQVLQTLPKLTEDLEYRFINDTLIILDTHAHVIADFIDNALPK
jgi:hypothetical protein